MSIIRVHRKKHNFSMIDNEAAESKELSWGARGLLWYLLTKPDQWEIRISHLANQSETEKEKRAQSLLRELETKGYVIRWSERGERGRIQWYSNIFESLADKDAWLKAHGERLDNSFRLSKGTATMYPQRGGGENARNGHSEDSDSAIFTTPPLSTYGATTYGQTGSGKGGVLVNTERPSIDLVITDSLSLERKSEERETFANAPKSEEDLQKMQILEDAIATEPELPKQNPTFTNKTQTVEGQYSAAAPPEIFGIKRWEDFKGPGLVQPFWDSMVSYGQKLDKVPTLIDVWAQEQIRKNGQLYWEKYQAAEAKRQAAEAALAAQTIAEAQPEEPREMPLDTIARIMQAQGLTPADVVPEVKSEYRAVFNRLPSDPQEAWDLLSRAQLSIVAAFLEKKYATP